MSGSFVFRRDRAEARRRLQPSGPHELGDFGRLHVRDVRRAAVYRIDLARVDVDADRIEAGASQLHGERQADVAETDDAGAGAVRVDLVEKFVSSR
jgi:hypothetical protein